MRLLIQRIYQHDCTVGLLNCDRFRCFTLELPWGMNKKNFSCVPEGTYEAFKHESPKNGSVIMLKNVVGRSGIQIHAGNYTSQIEGCILVGDSLKDINADGVIDVTNSKATLSKLLDLLPDTFEVVIK